QVVIEKEMFSGGQIVTTDRVDNYLGLYGESGYDLAVKFREHADKLGVPFMEDEVSKITDKGEYKEVYLKSGKVIETKAIVIATGANHRKLKVKGEKELTGAGVSYCATCDGAFFKGKNVAVAGGGDVALEDALYLSNLCEKVYLIHRREELRASKELQQKVMSKDNIEFMPFYEIKEINGENKVENIMICQNQTGKNENLDVSGVFIAVGMEPQSDFLNGVLELDKAGYIKTGEDCRTSVPGIYAAGDVRTKSLRQIITAVADGAYAISSLEKDVD
ncbi:MAG: FAD-dependent oxidoreductase, partial [Lachnospiraceae bacterium]|nr:FAD-dependent oxidoreductase [Lachnospiraceae bacterium]